MAEEQHLDSRGTTQPDPQAFRRVLAWYPTGVSVVTAMHDGAPVGMSANSFASVSLDPLLILFCAARSSTTWPEIHAAGAFAVNVLGADAEELARRFATRGVDRFAGVSYTTARTGAPVLEAALAYLDCRVHDVIEYGDHLVVLGAVVALGQQADANGEPLVFCGSEYRRLAPTAGQDRR